MQLFRFMTRNVIIALALSLAVTPASAAETIKVDNSFSGHGFGIRNGDPSLIILAKSINMGGRLAVCGVYFVDSTSSTERRYAKQAVRQIQFEIEGKPIFLSAQHLNQIGSIEEAPGAAARCKASKIVWKPAFSKKGAVPRAKQRIKVK